MSTNNGKKSRIKPVRRPSKSLMISDYKSYCRQMWIRRQKGRLIHVKTTTAEK